jgi:serine/threonine-protein kinase
LTKLKALPPVKRHDPRREPEGLVSGDLVGDRYRLEDVLGRGGMGEVWSAFDRKLGRRVAVKVVTFRGRERAERGRFTREAQISRQLRGPSFVEVYDHGFVGDQAYLVMELLDGETLQQRLSRVRTLSLEQSVQLVRGVAVSLRLAHTLQIVHRDLKPANIYFARSTAARSGVQTLDGSREIIKLFDFGIAKDAWDDTRLTRPGTMLGSAHYMSPEQIRCGRDVDARSDLWSLAVIVFRSLTGERPFSGAAPDALAHILNDEPPSICSIDPTLPRALEPFFKKAFAKEAILRFQTVDELAQAYAAATRGEAIDLPEDGSSVLEAIDRLGVTSRPPAKRPGPPPLPQALPPAPPPAPPPALAAARPLDEIDVDVDFDADVDAEPSLSSADAEPERRDLSVVGPSIPSPWRQGRTPTPLRPGPHPPAPSRSLTVTGSLLVVAVTCVLVLAAALIFR